MDKSINNANPQESGLALQRSANAFFAADSADIAQPLFIVNARLELCNFNSAFTRLLSALNGRAPVF